MAQTLKALSVLLTYPEAAVQVAAPEIEKIIREEGILPDHCRDNVFDLLEELKTGDLYDLEERYTLLFDRTRSLSLHLFEHVHGEGRDRGQALVDLLDLYQRHGLELDGRELPDFLPLFLEFLSLLPLDEARPLLAETSHILGALRDRHAKRESIYAGVFDSLLALVGNVDAGDVVVPLTPDKDDDPNNLEALDEAWEEEQITFGPGAAGTAAPGGGCPAARETLAHMDRAQMNRPLSE